MRKVLYLQPLMLAAISAVAQVSAPFIADFEKHSAGAYTDAMSKEDFPQYNSSLVSSYGDANRWSQVPDGRAEIVDEGGNKVLRVKYPQGCIGTDPNGCAIQIRFAFLKDEVADTMWASYRVKFEDGFEFVRGGKLPGLCGGKCYTGCVDNIGDGWSARIMWRGGGDIVQYMYFSDRKDRCGDDMKWDFTGTQKKFQIGVWHKVATQVILNTVHDGASIGERNGIVRSWLDGEQSLEVDTVRFVDYADQKINRFYFSTFHGGSDETWAPTKDVYARFDDFRISTIPPEDYNSSSSESSSSNASSSSISSSSIGGEGSSSSGGSNPIMVSKIAKANGMQPVNNGVLLQATNNAFLEIFNLNGSSVRKMNFASGIYSIELSDLPKGLYIAKVRFENLNAAILKVPVKN